MGNTLRNIVTIASKELRSYFGSATAWVMMALFAAIFSVFFVLYIDAFMRAGMQSQFGAPPSQNVNNDLIRPVLQNASVLVLFLLPMVTMRTYSEEKRSGTIELLLTSPVTDFEIITGKFLGAVGLYCGLLLVTALYVGLLYGYGSPEWRPILSGYLGLFLMGSCFISLGLFVSSTTKSQMVAGAGTFVLALLFWIISWLSETAGPTIGPLLTYLSITQHFEDFAKGVIDTKHVIFYLSFITFCLFMTLKSVDSERWRG